MVWDTVAWVSVSPFKLDSWVRHCSLGWSVPLAGLLEDTVARVRVSLLANKMSSFKSNENIHKKKDGSYYVVLANTASSVTL